MGSPARCPVIRPAMNVVLFSWLLAGGGFQAIAFGENDSVRENQPSQSLNLSDRLSTSPIQSRVLLETTERQQAFAQLTRDAKVIQRLESVVRRVAKLLTPSVVHIQAEKQPYATSYEAETVEEAGSGVIVDLGMQKCILTNRHVVHNCELHGIHISYWDGRQAHPTKILSDPSTDVAVLEIEEQDLIAARLGNSEQLEIGDFVLALGSPFGLSHSVTHGIVSAKSRRDLILGTDEVHIQDFIQTDAAINPGNSGGPLLNLEGEVVGVNTAIVSNSGGNEGIGFSIPANLAMLVAERLIRDGELRRSYLGVRLDNAFTAYTAKQMGLPQFHGAKVTSITTNSPAAIAGLEPGDIILQFNGVKVMDSGHLVNLVGLSRPGGNMSMVYFRDGKLLSTSVQVAERTTVHR